MDRTMLVELFKRGLRYPVGTHQIWVARCYEVAVRPDRVVVDEYECYGQKSGGGSRNGSDPPERRYEGIKPIGGMYHRGRSIVSLKNQRVVREMAGDGWLPDGQDRQARRRGTMRV